jgi:ABC-2 type transport system ATP-binding protein
VRPSQTPAVSTRELTRVFDGRPAVEGVTIDVVRGEVFALLGPNGAGKTTTVRMLCCLLAPTSGSASVLGFDVRRDAQAVRARVGLLTEAPGLSERLSAWNNLLFFARLYGVRQPERQVEHYLRLLDLWDERHQRVGRYSRGMRQKVALARSLVHEPELVFLDEPTANLDVATARVVRGLIDELKRRGRTLFLTSHNLDEAERLADRIGVLDRTLIAAGRPEALRRRYFPRRFLVRLAQPQPSLASAALAVAAVTEAQLDGELLTVSVSDADAVPDLVAALVAGGARIRAVEEQAVDLEEVYLRVLGTRGAELDAAAGSGR